MSMTKHMTAAGYVFTYVALMVLATATLLLARLEVPGDLAIAMGIAALKAGLVLWFFMHLYEQRFANRVVILVSIVLVVILVALTATDVASRHTFPPGVHPGASSPGGSAAH
jgi:cytochrome c oxidase subunit IV